MAFVDNQMAIICNDVGDLAITYQALDQSHVNDAGRLSFPTANDADLLRVDVQKGTQSLHPLGQQFTTMDKHQRVPGPMGDKCGGDNRLAKRRRGGKHSSVVGYESFKSPGLRSSQFPLERNACR